MTSVDITIIENFVNSQEAVDLVEDHWDWDALWFCLNPKLSTPLTEEEEQDLHDDLRDWWKNGNFYIWGEEEINSFGMGKWSYDPDWRNG